VVASFALLLHPLVAPSLGRSWQAAELFGVMPDPTAVATLGILLLASNRAHWTLQAIPVAWCVISGATLLTIDAPDALTAPLLAVATVPFAVAKQMTARRALRAGPGSPQPLAGP
jgi:hypothetical protein